MVHDDETILCRDGSAPGSPDGVPDAAPGSAIGDEADTVTGDAPQTISEGAPHDAAEPAGEPGRDDAPSDGDVPVEEPGPSLFLVHCEPYSANYGQTLALARALHAENWDVHIICRASCRLATAASACALPVHTLSDAGGKGLLAAWKILRLIRKYAWKPARKDRKRIAPRKILAHACDPLASHVIADVWRMDKKLRIAHTRRVPIMEPNSKAVRCYQTPPAKIVTDSLAGKIALRLSGVETHLLHTIPCGFDAAGQPARRDREDGRMVFAVVGDLLPERGHSFLFEALALLEDIPGTPPWEVRILGEGPHFQALLDDAHARGVAGHLAFLGGAETDRQLAECDALILPAGDGESHMPLILQGWAAEVPLVAINRLDHAESLQEDANCVLVQPGDAAGLAAQMARLAGDAELRAHLVRGGLAALAKFDVETMTLEHKRLYGQILA